MANVHVAGVVLGHRPKFHRQVGAGVFAVNEAHDRIVCSVSIVFCLYRQFIEWCWSVAMNDVQDRFLCSLSSFTMRLSGVLICTVTGRIPRIIMSCATTELLYVSWFSYQADTASAQTHCRPVNHVRNVVVPLNTSTSLVHAAATRRATRQISMEVSGDARVTVATSPRPNTERPATLSALRTSLCATTRVLMAASGRMTTGRQP